MPVLEIVGWTGAGLVVLSMLQQRIVRLRAINLAGCVLQVFYNGVLGVWPVVGLNAVLSVVQVVNLTRLLRTRHSAEDYEVLPARPDEAYLNHVIASHAADIARYTPTFHPAHGTAGADLGFLVVRGAETVGVVLLADAGDGVAQIELDYVTEKYRDFTPGEFVFRRSGAIQAAGFSKVVTPPGMVEPYYSRIGFDKVGERYEMQLAPAA